MTTNTIREDIQPPSKSNDIDWNFIPDESSYINENEPDAPLRRSIYPQITQPGWKVQIHAYNPAWPEQFQQIKAHLVQLLTTSRPPTQFISIEHIGSTSIPGLCAKPNIDVIVVLPNSIELDNALEAFAWEIPSEPPFIKYSRVPEGGGIQGRESLKLYVSESSPYYTTTPERSVYLICEQGAGKVQIRCYRDVKKTLCEASNRDLFNEYANLKMELATRVFPDSITYSRLKNDMVRKILKRAGWTDAEVDEKERLSDRRVRVDEPPY